MTTNALSELTYILSGDVAKEENQILCAYIAKYKIDEQVGEFILKKGYSKEDYNKFFTSLNFEYVNKWKRDYLTGTVWFTDGSWLSRSVRDNNETFWEYHKMPEIPEFL